MLKSRGFCFSIIQFYFRLDIRI